MSLGQKGYFSNNEEDQEEEEVVMKESPPTIMFPFSSSLPSSSPFNYKNLVHDHDVDDKKKLESMELSLGRNDQDHNNNNNNNNNNINIVEKEHMFDKVVTPSDVGKLNRLVIPKQHAEKYFPLDSSSNEKGLLLNFEDRNGKPWRFRYSYWNSSQSYVMTKGWSRFVKEKKLDAGDIVSFQRGVGESGKDHLYIDWRRRPDQALDPSSIQMHNHYFAQSMNWSTRLYSSLPRNYDYLNNYSRFYPYHQNQIIANNGNYARYYLSAPSGPVHDGAVLQEGVVIDSVPVAHRKTIGKNRGLRLFGVNMECATSSSQSQEESSNKILPNGSSSDNKGKSSSLSFDLDL